MTPVPSGERGMILVNVLMIVAIASGLVLLMISREELALDRSIRAREAARALAVVRGGELSALVALTRDAQVAAEADYATEPWGALSERGAPIEGGRFDLAIADAQGRFNVNAVRGDDALAPQLLFGRIATAAGVPEAQALAAIALIRERGPVTDLAPLASVLEPAVAARLATMVTALPGRTAVNLNAAPRELLEVLLNDPAAAARLNAVRDRQGFLSPDDFSRADTVVPPGAGFRSDTFWVVTQATIGDTRQRGATLIRRVQADGVRRAVPVARWRNAALPPDAPGFP